MARSTADRARAGVGASLLALGLVACGGQSEGSESAQQTQGFADLEPGDEVQPEQLVERLRAPGAETLSSFGFTADLTMEQQQVAVTGAVDVDGDSPAAEVTMDLPPLGTVDLLLVDEAAFASIPDLTPPGKYIEVPLEQLDEVGVEDLTESLDVDELMDTWDSSAQEVTFVGEEDVAGTTTDHVEIVLDPQQMLEEAGKTASPEMEISGEVTYGIWIDEENLIRKMELDIEQASATVRLDDWGQDLQVQAPAPSDVVQMPNF
jgi:hypothetical protein